MSTFLYIGDSIVDLSPKSVVAITVQKINVADIKKRFVNFTPRLKAIHTENNAAIFGHASNEASLTTIPYTLLSCKIVQNGIEIMPDGRCIVTGVDEEGYDLNIYENYKELSVRITGKRLSDIAPISDSAWTASAIDSARTNTSGIISAILSWGKPGAIYQYDYFLPCFFYHTFVTKILEFTGLTLSGNILTDARFKDLVVPYFKDDFLYPETVIQDLPARATLSGPQTVNALSIATSPEIVVIDFLQYGTKFNIATYSYEYDLPDYDIQLSFTAFVTIENIVYNSGTTLTVELRKNGVTVLDSYTVVGDPDSNTLTFTGFLTNGDDVRVEVYSDAPGIGIDFDIVDVYMEVSATRIVDRASVSWNTFFNDIKCEDLLRDFYNRFGIIQKQVNSTLYLKTIEEICADTDGSLDWSDKLVKAGKPINFRNEWSQNNYFNHQNAVSDIGLGRGNLSIADETISEEKNVFDSLFENCITSTVNSNVVAVIPIYDSTSTSIGEFIDPPGIKVLTIKSRVFESAITFDAVPRTDFKLAYFVDPTQPKDTGFQYFVDEFYPSLSESLQKNKVINKLYNLTEIDILNCDPHKMIYDGEGYYILNKIPNFISGKISKVELFKVR